MTRTILYLTLALSLTTNAWLIGFNAGHMEQRARLYAIDRLETAAMSLKEPQVAEKPHDMTMPPIMSVADLERLTEMDQRKADVIAQILEGSVR